MVPTSNGPTMNLKKMTGKNITVKSGESFEDAVHRTVEEKNNYIKTLYASMQGLRGIIIALVIVLILLLYALMSR